MLLTILVIVNPYIIQEIIKYFSPFFPVESHIEWFAALNPLTEMYNFFFGITLYFAVKDHKENIYFLILSSVLITTKFSWHPYEIFFTILLIFLIKVPLCHPTLKQINLLNFLVMAVLDYTFPIR